MRLNRRHEGEVTSNSEAEEGIEQSNNPFNGESFRQIAQDQNDREDMWSPHSSDSLRQRAYESTPPRSEISPIKQVHESTVRGPYKKQKMLQRSMQQ
jgi:hypothetical protein